MIDEWLVSDKAIHSILDHPCHGNLMGCGFGINNIAVRERYPEKIIDMNKYITDLVKKKIYDVGMIRTGLETILWILLKIKKIF